MSWAMTDDETILCAIDYSAPSLRAAKLAGSIAGKFAAELLLLTIVDVIDARQKDNKQCPEREHDLASLGVGVAEIAEDALRSQADRIASRFGLYVAWEVRIGPAAAQIVAAASEHASDMLVLGYASRSRLARALLGSTARRVIAMAPCPVLVVP
jgi:nucleotide-binding universal stress UspA family protein